MARTPKKGRQRNPYKRADALTKRARAEGYSARSVFKLQEIDRRVRLLKPGMHVLDLGAAPGSWSAFAAEKIGKKGQLVAIDLQPLRQQLRENCIVVLGDAFDEKLTEEGPIAEHAPYDLVISDMAPNTTGHRETDKIRSTDVFMRALEMAKKLGKPSSNFVGKIFMSGHFPDAKEAVRLAYDKVRIIRPDAVRDISSEVYLVGLTLRSR